MSLLGSRKTLDRMGKTINEGAGSAVSSFARKQMEKMGWQEGKGLGKNEDGMATHIKQKKKEDVAGLGADKTTDFVVDSTLKGGAKTSITGGNDNWWHDAFSSKLKSLNNKKKDKKRKRGDEDDDAEAVADAPPSMEDLFKATGGARLGMRARADMSGKFQRAEKDVSTALPDEKTDKKERNAEGTSQEKREKREKKREKKEKKEKKKEKKEKRERG